MQMTSVLWPNCYLGRASPPCIPQIGAILLPFFALVMWGLSTSLSIWSSKSGPYHHGYPSYEGQFIPLMTYTSFSYVCLSRSHVRVDGNCSYPSTYTSITSFKCWGVFFFIKSIAIYLIIYVLCFHLIIY